MAVIAYFEVRDWDITSLAQMFGKVFCDCSFAALRAGQGFKCSSPDGQAIVLACKLNEVGGAVVRTAQATGTISRSFFKRRGDFLVVTSADCRDRAETHAGADTRTETTHYAVVTVVNNLVRCPGNAVL